MLGTFHYVYILSSHSYPGRHYTGLTDNLATRLESHNSGQVPHTSTFRPWTVEMDVIPSQRTRTGPCR
jgi:predicted GIY-YIG superfamily endonuclease